MFGNRAVEAHLKAYRMHHTPENEVDDNGRSPRDFDRKTSPTGPIRTLSTRRTGAEHYVYAPLEGRSRRRARLLDVRRLA